MAIEVRYSVISPEAERQKLAPGVLPPGMGGPPPGVGGPRVGMGRPSPRTEGPPSGMAPPEPASFTFARRLDTLENKTIYLVDIGFGGGYNFMLQLQKWFTEHMPSVTAIVRRKPGRVFADDNNELWEEIKEKGHAVILGVAG